MVSESSTILPSAHVATGSPRELDADLATVIARRSAVGRASFGYTVESSVTGMSSTTDDVIAIEGHAERVAIQTSSFSGWGDAQVTIPGMFDLIRSNRDRSGTIQATYDPVLGYPLTIRRDDPAVSDGSWSMQVRDFRSSLEVPPTHGDLDARLAEARAAWDRWAPSDYAYDWQLDPVDDGATGVGWSIRHVDGVTTATPSFGDTATTGREAASMTATFDAIEAAAARAAWVDAVFDPVLGLPILVGIDPTPVAGDGSWQKVAFHDIVAETGRALANGGHVDATYDVQLGYPTQVTIDAPGSLVEGTITIGSVVIDDAG